MRSTTTPRVGEAKTTQYKYVEQITQIEERNATRRVP